jgi:hypothetical protein
MIKKLEEVYEDLTATSATAKLIYNAVRDKDFFTHSWKLNKRARELLGKKRVSMEALFAEWIPRWKAEGRLSANGLQIRLGKAEADLLELKEGELVNIYDLSSKCSALYDNEN